MLVFMIYRLFRLIDLIIDQVKQFNCKTFYSINIHTVLSVDQNKFKKSEVYGQREERA